MKATREIDTENVTPYRLWYHQEEEVVELCSQVDKTVVIIKGEENKYLSNCNENDYKCQ